ncbi:MAG: hypothetical protein IJ449_12915 [Clostridia bacterium]|nr:hypothetical protein [Clostridia bacterium]
MKIRIFTVCLLLSLSACIGSCSAPKASPAVSDRTVSNAETSAAEVSAAETSAPAPAARQSLLVLETEETVLPRQSGQKTVTLTVTNRYSYDLMIGHCGYRILFWDGNEWVDTAPGDSISCDVGILLEAGKSYPYDVTLDFDTRCAEDGYYKIYVDAVRDGMDSTHHFGELIFEVLGG